MEELTQRRKEMVLALIRDRQYKPMRPREMAGFLQVPKSERGGLGAILDELCAQGEISVDSFGRYVPVKNETAEGIFQGTERGFGFVTVEGEEGDWYIPAQEKLDAIDGDRVRVIKLRDGGTSGKMRFRTEARVVAVLARGTKSVVGIFKKNRIGGFVSPDRSRFDFDLTIPADHTLGAVSGQKVCAEIVRYGDRPVGHITEILGHVNDPGVDILSVVRAYDIPSVFPPEVIAEATAVPAEVKEADIAGRHDLRDWFTVTIDGEEAKDLDDAVTYFEEDGRRVLGVHIADVSAYVKEDSALDKEAVNRGTSVYLADRVIPMLPHALSNGICSLNQGEDRLALSCIMEVSEDGEVLSHSIEETVIRVNHRLSYTQVQGLFDHAAGNAETDNCPEDAAPMLLAMEKLSAVVRKRREARGAIDFDFPESKILLNEAGRVVSIEPHARNRATELIEDFMVLANETVAEEFFWLSMPFVYRVHEEPSLPKIRELSGIVSRFGYRLHVSDRVYSKELQKFLSGVRGKPEEALLARITLRSMKQARYATECLGHFGLASRYYCHFTSPIRRYPDLQIHRIIKEYLHGTLTERRIHHYGEILPERAKQSSMTERRSEDAERDVCKMKKAEYMRGFLGEEFDGVISGVTAWGIYVELPNTVEGLIRLTDLRGDYYIYDANGMALTGERTGRRYEIGQPMHVIVSAADKLSRTVEFVPG
ncbi:MAG: ribonuclease R [Lachnospiraceae bacterium]|nr:ribonuclease R [Lachnospiraceae bacterium]